MLRVPRMSRERLAELVAENEEDLALARRLGLRPWVETLARRQHSLWKIEVRMPPEADEPVVIGRKAYTPATSTKGGADGEA